MIIQDLTAHILVKWTLMLIERQIRPYDPRFVSTYATTYNREHLADTIDSFTERYLHEAADTAVNRYCPVERVPSLELPDCKPCARVRRGGLTVRMVMAYDVWWDVDRLRIDVTWEPQQ